MGSPLLPHNLICEPKKLFTEKKLVNAATSISWMICLPNVFLYHVRSQPGHSSVHLDVGSMCHDVGLSIKGI